MKTVELSSSAYQLTLLQTQLYRTVRELMKTNLKKHDVTFVQWFVLSHVCRGPIQGYTMSEIAESLSISMSQLTSVCKQLVDRRWLRQKVSNRDKRQKAIRCTSSGKALCESIELDLDHVAVDWLGQLEADKQAGYFALMRSLQKSRPKYVGMQGATIVAVKRKKT